MHSFTRIYPVEYSPLTNRVRCSKSKLIGQCSTSLLFCSLIIALVLFPATGHSQLSIDSLGTDTSQNELYECVRYTNASQNTITVTDESHQEKSFSISQAAKRVKRSLRRAKTRAKRLNRRLKDLKSRLKNIQTTLLPRPSSGTKIKKLKKAIKKTKKALGLVRGQQKNLVNLRKQIDTCKDDAPLVGGVVIKTLTYPSIFFNGEYTSYHIGIFFNVVRPVQNREAFCLGSSQFYEGVKLSYVTIDPCPVMKSNYECIARHSGVRGFGLTGVAGTDYQYACAPGDEPFRCDIGKAHMKAAELAAQYSDVVVLGRADGSSCERFKK